MNNLFDKNANKARLAVYVRCTPEEFSTLEELSKESGESAATLLKKKFFESKTLHTLFPVDERKQWFGELRRIGNNINQIAKKLNSGFLEGWYPEIEEMKNAILRMQSMVVSVYGNSHV